MILAIALALQAQAAPVARFEKEVARFEASDQTSMPPRDAVVFAGSSTIERWNNLQQDFPSATVIQRGIGSTRLDDWVRFAPRIVIPYHPKQIVLYAGDNDFADGQSADNVYRDYKDFARVVRSTLPDAEIVFVSIKPSPSRWKYRERMRRANALVKAYIRHHRKMRYVDVFNPMLGANGHPRPELFVSDSLHMTPAGYALWASILKPVVK
jgi:Lysophospholipase L1 and related esterases